MTAASRTQAPTLELVAARAGVSRATVSRVVNGSPSVSPPIEAAVRQAITELGYVPNRAARSLARQRTQAIALIVPEDVVRFFGDPFIADVVAGIDERLEDSDYVLNLMIANHDPTGKTMRFLAGGAVDGAIVVSHHTSDRFLDHLLATLPVVFSGRSTLLDSSASVVDVDNRGGARLGTQRLIDRGCRRIGIITGPLTMHGATDRLSGWRDAIDAAGLEPGPVADGDFTMTGGMRAMREILDDRTDMDGIFVSSDLMASGAIPVILERGLRIPEDLAVVGFDDSSAATSGAVKLTTVRQPSRQMGREMAQLLIDILDQRVEGPREVILPTELVVRDSA